MGMTLKRVCNNTIICFVLCLPWAQTPAQEISTGLTGGGQPHNNMQPYIAMQYGVATDPVFSADASTSNHILGEVAAWPYPESGGSLSGSLPGGWTLADGRLLDIVDNQALFGVLGTTYGGDGTTTFALPDLRGRTPVGVGDGPGLSSVALGQITGVETVTLSEAQLPAHDHTTSIGPSPVTGGGASYTNLMPGLGIRCLIAFQGNFPFASRVAAGGTRGVSAAGEQFLAEMRWYAGTLPDTDILGWADCDGRSVSIASQSAMFSLLGTNYGGDGRTFFNYPDLRGRVMLHYGSGSGLSSFNLGQRSGNENTTLTIASMPMHTHTVLGALPGEISGSAGSGIPVGNHQPYLAVNHSFALSGSFPGTGAIDSTLVGQLLLFAGNFPPRDFALMNGQTLAINQNTALYALILDTFGSDNMTFLRLPQGRGRVVIGSGPGTGLSARTVGELAGEETHTLTLAELPEHRHGKAPDDGICWAVTSANGNAFTACL